MFSIKYKFNLLLFFSSFALFLLVSCKSTPKEEVIAEDAATHAEEEHHEHTVAFTEAQIKNAGIELGSFTTIKSDGFIKANGVLDLPPQSIATVHAPTNGYVETVKNFLPGSFVKAGTILTTLSHPSFIEQQQAYLEILPKLTYLKQEIARQQQLSDANANARKVLEQAQSDYDVLLAKQKGIKAQLQYLGIDISKVESGTISSTIAVHAPISGYITTANVHKGMFIQPTTLLYEIINNNHVHLELEIFEQDIAKIKQGQALSFTIPSLGQTSYKGEVHLIDKTFDPQDKTIRVHGHITGKHPPFTRGLYVEAKIWQTNQTTQALPNSAIVIDGSEQSIFIKSSKQEHDGKIIFEQIPVRLGEKEGDLVAVTPLEAINNNAIVTKGAFYLHAEMHKGEHEHDH